jgi:glycosyltransferase involved in cell wall biosynthesis
MTSKIKSLSILFPVYKDESTVEHLIKKSVILCNELSIDYEIVVVNDNCPNGSGKIVQELSKSNNKIKLINHKNNLGYGIAIRNGLELCTKQWILQTDGDNQYDINEFKNMEKIIHNYDCIITFRYKKIYGSVRIFISWIYNKIIQILFKSRFRDISTGLRLIKKETLDDINLISKNAFIGAEIPLKLMLKGYQVGEVGITTYPRRFGTSTLITFKNILNTLRDIINVRKEIFK